MKKVYLKLFLILIFLALIALVPNASLAISNYDNEYEIQSYNIDMVVNENNTFDITETITAYFNVPKHGIYRKIPLKNSIIREDGSKSSNRVKITNIAVNNEYTTSKENGYEVIQIGNANSTITGSHTYTIKYTYNIGKDPVKNADELYFNLIGNEWDTTISGLTFNIKMPKEFDKSTLGFTTGSKGSNAYPSELKYEVEGNKITGTLGSTLKAGEGLTIRLTLPDEYFVGASSNFDIYSIFVIVFSIGCASIAFLIWQKHGKDDEVIETVEFYPPEGFNSAEIGFLYEGEASEESIISLLVYLADKGYLKIEETEQKVLFSTAKVARIIKLKEYDGDNECERIFFNGLFEHSNSKGTLIRASDIQRAEKRRGNTISWEEAKKRAEKEAEKEAESAEGKESVIISDLYDKFYKTIGKISSILNTKENKNKIFESMASGKYKYLIFMIIAIFILITVKPVMDFAGGEFLPFAIIFPGLGFSISLFIFLMNREIFAKIFALIWGLGFGGVPWAFIVLPSLTYYPIYLLTYIIGFICIALLMLFIKIMPKRTKYGNEMLGRIRGFKRFLETAEKEQLESLVEQNPEYFYNILPYTYALGVSEIWMNQFETIAMRAPDWYDSRVGFSVGTFHNFMDNTMRSAQNAMISSPSTSSGGGSSSGGFSGGGSSGGGSGGGGGGSW